MAAVLVDTEKSVQEMLEALSAQQNLPSPGTTSLIFVDVEGVDLSRHGKVSVLQILAPPLSSIFLLDVHVLKHAAFNTASAKGITLKQILESNQWAKVFFDVRNDSDALYSHFGINLSCVVDIQLMEIATRRFSAKFLHGLSRCVENDLNMTFSERHKWVQTKETGKKLFMNERGSDFGVFLERPLPDSLVQYCTQDIQVLPKLLIKYAERLSNNKAMAQAIFDEGTARIKQSQGINYNGKGRHMAIRPSFRLRSVPNLQFPMDTICSPNLQAYCTLRPAEDIPQPSLLPVTRDIATIRIRKDPHGEPSTATTKEQTPPKPPTNETNSFHVSDLKAVLPDMSARSDSEDEYTHDRSYDRYTRDYSPEPPRDLTACDKECGYCGQCDY